MGLNLSETYDLKTYWKWCGIGIGAALFLVAISLAMNAPDVPGGFGLEPLLFVVDPVQAAINTLGVLFVIALFVERANEIFVSSTRAVLRKQAELEIDDMENRAEAGTKGAPTSQDILKAKNVLLTYRTGTRILTITFAVIVATLLALAGVRALSPLLEVQFDALAHTQWAVLQFVDIVLTVAIIGGGSSGIHNIISIIVDQFPEKKRAINAATEPH